MTRNNADFRNQVMFHGSPHVFNVGDVVNPGSYATNDEELASQFGAVKGYSVTNLQSNEHGVYQVEPIGNEVEVKHPDPTTKKTKYFVSKEGFRVVKRVR